METEEQETLTIALTAMCVANAAVLLGRIVLAQATNTDDEVYMGLMVALIREDWIKIPDFCEKVIPLQLHQQFRRFFRMSITSVNELVELLRPHHVGKSRPSGRTDVPLEKKVLMYLNYVGSQETGFMYVLLGHNDFNCAQLTSAG